MFIKISTPADILLGNIEELVDQYKQSKRNSCNIFNNNSRLLFLCGQLQRYIAKNRESNDLLLIIRDIFNIVRNYLESEDLAELVSAKLLETFDIEIRMRVQCRLTTYINLAGAIKPSSGRCLEYILKCIKRAEQYNEVFSI